MLLNKNFTPKGMAIFIIVNHIVFYSLPFISIQTGIKIAKNT